MRDEARFRRLGHPAYCLGRVSPNYKDIERCRLESGNGGASRKNPGEGTGQHETAREQLRKQRCYMLLEHRVPTEKEGSAACGTGGLFVFKAALSSGSRLARFLVTGKPLENLQDPV